LFRFSFVLWIKPGLFLLLSSALISFSLITHVCFSLLGNDLWSRDAYGFQIASPASPPCRFQASIMVSPAESKPFTVGAGWTVRQFGDRGWG
jgi:hypothetical protein